MTKITKKEYNSRKKELQDKIDKLQHIENFLTQQADDMTRENHSAELVDKLGDFWNSLHDEIYCLKKEIGYLQDEWDTRNWTHSDHMEWELVSNNID